MFVINHDVLTRACSALVGQQSFPLVLDPRPAPVSEAESIVALCSLRKETEFG